MSEPAAWYVRHSANEPPLLFTDEERAKKAAFSCGCGARPLYLSQVSSQQNLTAAERGAVDRARIAFRDMDHNDMTMQQLEDYEAFCGLLARLGGCTPQLDCGADRKSVASERCRDTGGQPFDPAPITVSDEEREAVTRALAHVVAAEWEYGEKRDSDTAASLRGLLNRLTPQDSQLP